MTTLNYLSKSEMTKRTGMPNALGYADPNKDEILIRKGLPKKVEAEVRRHEAEHIERGEEGPFLPLVGAVLGGILAKKASDKATDAQVASGDAAIDEQRRQYDLARQDLAPYRQIGTQALNTLSSLYGYTPYQPEAESTPYSYSTISPMLRAMSPDGQSYSSPFGETFNRLGRVAGAAAPNTQPAPSGLGAFYESPDYQFRRQEGTRDIGNSFAARGGSMSGNALRALAQYNSGLASQEFGNFFNRQAALAGIGQTATNTGIGAGQQTAANVGNALIGQGEARASGIYGRNAAYQNALGGGLDWWANRGGGGVLQRSPNIPDIAWL